MAWESTPPAKLGTINNREPSLSSRTPQSWHPVLIQYYQLRSRSFLQWWSPVADWWICSRKDLVCQLKRGQNRIFDCRQKGCRRHSSASAWFFPQAFKKYYAGKLAPFSLIRIWHSSYVPESFVSIMLQFLWFWCKSAVKYLISDTHMSLKLPQQLVLVVYQAIKTC